MSGSAAFAILVFPPICRCGVRRCAWRCGWRRQESRKTASIWSTLESERQQLCEGLRVIRRRSLRRGGPVAGAGLRSDVSDVERFGAFAADDDGMHVVDTGAVMQDEGSPFGTGEPAFAPGRHGGKDRVDASAFVGEAVLTSGRSLLVFDPAEQLFVNETVQSMGEDVASDPERGLEVVEAAGPETRLANDQQVPVVAEDVDAAGDGARPARCVGAFHRNSLSR